MPRKCCVEKYRSMHFGTDENVTVFSFPADNDECDKWIQAFTTNEIINVTKCNGVYEKHVPTEYEKIWKKDSNGLCNPAPLLKDLLYRNFHQFRLLVTFENGKRSVIYPVAPIRNQHVIDQPGANLTTKNCFHCSC